MVGNLVIVCCDQDVDVFYEFMQEYGLFQMWLLFMVWYLNMNVVLELLQEEILECFGWYMIVYIFEVIMVIYNMIDSNVVEMFGMLFGE